MRSRRRAKSAATPPATPGERADLKAAVATLDPEDTPPGKLTSGQPRLRGRGRSGREPEATASDRAGGSGRSGRSGRSSRSSRSAASGGDATAVNLLSPWVLEEIHVRTLRRRFAYAALALVVALGLAWGGLTLQADRARTALAGEESIGTTLSTQIAQMAPVRVYVSGVDARAQAITDAMAGQVAFSTVLAGLEAALPPQATLDTMTVTLPTPVTGADGAAAADPTAGTCPGPDPFAITDVVACLDLTGTAVTRDVVSTLVLRLGRNPLFAEPFVSTTTASEDGEDGRSVTFVGSVALTADVANTRFVDLVERLGSTKAAAAAKAARETREAAEAAGTDPATGAGTQAGTDTAAGTGTGIDEEQP